MTTTPKHYEPKDGVDPTAVVDDIGFWARLAFKYIWRAQMKDGIRDIDKALDTLERIYKAEPEWFLPRTRKTDIGVKGNQDLHRCAYPSAFSPLARDRALTFYARVMLGETRIIERCAGNVIGVASPARKIPLSCRGCSLCITDLRTRWKRSNRRWGRRRRGMLRSCYPR